MGWFFAGRPPAPPRWPLERRWGDGGRPLPRRWVLPDGAAPPRRLLTHQPLDICARLRGLCADAARRCPDLSHIDMSRVLVTFTPSRTPSRYGLQARVTPMRFRDGGLIRRVRGRPYQVQRYFVDGREMLYLVTFCLPRFLDQTFDEKMVTVFHELYHIGERFDGDLRRHPGRYAVHSHSKQDYDRRMAGLVKAYLANHPDPEVCGFLRWGYADLWRYNGGITGVVVPRPKLLPVPA